MLTLLTLGLLLDGSGFVRRSKVLAGNVVESRTLAGMLCELGIAPGGLVVMDAGIATAANLIWLQDQGYCYLVVSRERDRHFSEGEVTLTTAGDDTIQVEKVLDEAAGEVRLYCYSARRELKETGINERFCQRFEAGLAKLAAGLMRPRGAKHPEIIHERIGRLKQASFGVGRHYAITVETDAAQTTVTRISWEKQPVAGSMLTEPGTYCLRSNETGWDEERLWRTYIMLTDLESVFRSLKFELGLRPIHHHKQETGRWASLHHRPGLPVCASPSPHPPRKGHHRAVECPAPHPLRPTPRHRPIQTTRRSYPLPPQIHPARSQTPGHLPSPRPQSPPRRHQETAFLTCHLTKNQ